jgi:hypothetical protein
LVAWDRNVKPEHYDKWKALIKALQWEFRRRTPRELDLRTEPDEFRITIRCPGSEEAASRSFDEDELESLDVASLVDEVIRSYEAICEGDG